MTSLLFENWPDEEDKICRICNCKLPLASFGKASGGNYYRTECKSCTKAIGAARDLAKALAPPVPIDHTCPICGRTEDEVKHKGGKKSGAWCCDHDHITGEFRGWLCHDCNRAIGTMNDSIERLLSAAEYLKKNKYGISRSTK